MFPALEDQDRVFLWRKDTWVPYAQGSSPLKQTTVCAGASWTSSHCPMEIGILETGASTSADTPAAAIDTGNKVLCL